MSEITRRLFVAAPLALAALPARADLYTPAVGTEERRRIMDAARVPIGNAVGRRIVFVVQVLNTDGRWTYLQGVPHNPDGSPIDWKTTPLWPDMQAGFMSDIAMVLLYDDGRGPRVVEWIMGPTDVFWIEWMQIHGLPERLFTR